MLSKKKHSNLFFLCILTYVYAEILYDPDDGLLSMIRNVMPINLTQQNPETYNIMLWIVES